MSKVLKVKILDPIYCKTLDPPTKAFIKTLLFYEKEFWRPGRFHKVSGTSKKYLIDGKGLFLTGFLPKIKSQAKLSGYDLQITGELEEISFHEPNLPGITFREDQLELIRKVLVHQRGVLKAPARSGKTVVASGIMSCFPDIQILFLCHTLSLLAQTENEFLRFNFDVGVFSGLRKELGHQLTLATHQSFVKRNPLDYCDQYDMVIIDECHHVTSINGNYGTILRNLLAPYRIGLTATPSEKKEQLLIMEGLLGPIIGETTSEQGQELGFLAKPKVNIRRIPEAIALKNYKTYHDIYRHGIILNRAYNRIIVKTALEFLDQDMTVLILVNRVQHGFYLKEIFNVIDNRDVPFLCGGMDSDSQAEARRLRKQLDKLRTTSHGKTTTAMGIIQENLDEIKHFEKRIKELSQQREIIRQKLNQREIPCVIATNIWNEGINIPSLNVLINGGGGKSEIRSIQVASRSLTAHEDKEFGIIVDFFNPNHWKLVEHFGFRISLYCDEGWM